MATRVFKGPPIYGSAASTDASSPNTGVNYRNADLTDASITAGLRGFNTNASSSNENEYLFRLSTLVDLIEKTGILGWNAETVYIAGSIVVADDKKIYQAVQGSTGVDPTTDPGTTWVNYITANSASVSDASESVKGILKLATDQQLIDLNDDNTAITPKKIGDRVLKANRIAIGEASGKTDQALNAIAVGSYAGKTSQSLYAIAMGKRAGETSQGRGCIAAGEEAGKTSQGLYAIAVGNVAGKTNQGLYAIAVGRSAGVEDQPDESIAIGIGSSPSSNGEIYIGSSDSSVFIGDGQVQAISDLRDKTNVADSNLGLNFIMQLQPKSWTANTRDHLEPNNDSKRIKGSRPHYGFIAQDVKKAMNSLGTDFAGYCELVHAATPAHKERVKDRLTLRYQEFIGPIVKAMQEQQAMIDELKKEVLTLKEGKDV